jgi:hypothetical protein
MRFQLGSEYIAAQASDQPHRVSKPGHGNGLVCALATRMNLKVRSCYGLANGRNSLGDRYQVCVDAAHDDDWFLPGHFEFPQSYKKAVGLL